MCVSQSWVILPWWKNPSAWIMKWQQNLIPAVIFWEDLQTLLPVVKPVAECHPWMPWMPSYILSASRCHVPFNKPGNSVPHRTCTLHGLGKKHSQASPSFFLSLLFPPPCPPPLCLPHTAEISCPLPRQTQSSSLTSSIKHAKAFTKQLPRQHQQFLFG